MASNIKMTTITEDDTKNTMKREQAQTMSKMTFAQLAELVQRNVTKNVNKTYTQYAKATVKQYLQNPATNLDNIREVSRFLERNSTLYKKILTYYAATPLFYYNLTQINDLSKKINNKATKNYYGVAQTVNGFDIKDDMFTAIYETVRDGMYVGYTYTDDTNTFLMPLDIKYCRIYGKNSSGQWIVYYDASYFDKGSNKIFVEGIDGDTNGCWDQCFIDGYNTFKSEGNSAQWFRLTPERAFAMISCSDDNFDVPLPVLSGMFVSLMDLLDLESVIASKTELENYKLLVGKIPLVPNSDDIDDFALSLDLVQQMQDLISAAVPELIGVVTSPFEIDTIDFSKSNSADDTDKFGEAIQNFFNNAGVSQIVISGGKSSNSVGLKQAISNDLSNIWIYVNRIESWLNYYIANNVSEGYELHIHKISWYNTEDYQSSMKDAATLGGSAMDYLTSLGDTPFIALQKLNFENALGIKQLMVPLASSYNGGSVGDNQGGRPQSDEGDLSSEGQDTRNSGKNENTKEANKS